MFCNWKSIFGIMLIAASGSVQATTYRLTATGFVNGLYGQDSGRNLDAAGTFQLGQRITYSSLFDTSSAMPDSYDVPNGIAYYNLGKPIEYSITIGDWQYNPNDPNNDNFKVQMTNDYTAGGGYDSEAFSLIDFSNDTTSLPYDMGGPTEIDSYTAFYGNTSILQSTKLTSLEDPENFPTRNFQIAFTSYGPSSTRQYLVQGNIDAQLSALPEAGTWIMMILGFGLLGGLARRNAPYHRGRLMSATPVTILGNSC